MIHKCNDNVSVIYSVIIIYIYNVLSILAYDDNKVKLIWRFKGQNYIIFCIQYYEYETIIKSRYIIKFPWFFSDTHFQLYIFSKIKSEHIIFGEFSKKSHSIKTKIYSYTNRAGMSAIRIYS